jgi:hypothetical protein
MPMTGSQPIEYYYPNGFGGSGESCKITWLPRYTIPNPIFERQTVGPNACIQMYVLANYTLCLESITNGSYSPRYGTTYINSFCCGQGVGPIKYAIVGGEFPPSLYLDIDTGVMSGVIDEIEVVAKEQLGIPDGWKFNESNYLEYAVPGIDVNFTVRAFDSGNPTTYNDRTITMHIRTNWSSRRDKFVLNIQNQFYLDGKPVDNATYIKGMKSKGYYPGPNCE